MQGRNFIFTVNNPEYFPIKLMRHGNYAIIAQEVAPTTGTPHLQGYCEFTRTVKATQIQQWLKAKAWIRPRKGTQDEARNYCMKPETEGGGPYKELGVFVARSQGQRTDLEALYKSAKDLTKTLRSIADEQPGPYMKFHRAAQHVRSLQLPPKERPLEVHVYYGPPGCGKTHAAMYAHPEMYCPPIAQGTSQWYDGYDGHTHMLLDEFSGQMHVRDLLKLLDKYIYPWPAKGSQVYLAPSHIYITTNIHPRRWYEWTGREVSYDALNRRVTEFREYTGYLEYTSKTCDRPLGPLVEPTPHRVVHMVPN